MSPLSKVAIIGRPNVGKSTLFNRILGKRVAIIEPSSGITRDRISKITDWDGFNFLLIDTGGILTSKNIDTLTQKVKEQSLKAIKEANVVILVTDAKEGLHPLDEEIASILKKERKRTIIAVNKVDNKKMESVVAEFYKLGLKDIIGISALHARGIDLLLEKVKINISKLKIQDIQGDYIKIAIIGRPNVGKSSFLNALLNEERVIVDARPGTTRDVIDTIFSLKEKKFVLIDTAGIKDKGKIKNAIEYFSSIRTQEAIDRADVILFMIDGWEGITHADLHYIYKIWEKGKGIVLGINKRDLIQKSIPEYEKLVRNKLPLAPYLPLVYISTKEHFNLKEAIWVCSEVYKNLKQRIKTSDLNRLLREENKSLYPKITKGKKVLKILYATQIDVSPPKIYISVNHFELINKNFKSFLEKKIRRKFGFTGVPIKLIFKERNTLKGG